MIDYQQRRRKESYRPKHYFSTTSTPRGSTWHTVLKRVSSATMISKGPSRQITDL